VVILSINSGYWGDGSGLNIDRNLCNLKNCARRRGKEKEWGKGEKRCEGVWSIG
jgi:hypothetical protein